MALFPKSSRVVSAEEKYQTLIKEHQFIIFTDGFSFESKKNDAFIKQFSEKYNQANAYVYNLSLDEALKKYIAEATNKELPLLIEGGEVR